MDKLIVLYGFTSFIARELIKHPRFSTIAYSLCLSSRDSRRENTRKVKSFLETHREINSILWLHFPAIVQKDTSLESVYLSVQKNINFLKDSMEAFESIENHTKTFFFLSSDRVGTSDEVFNELTNATAPIDAYGLSKAMCESVLTSRNRMMKCKIYKIIRACSVYGAGQINNQLIPKIIITCKN